MSGEKIGAATASKYTSGPWVAKPLNFGEFEIVSGKHEFALVYASDGMDEPTLFPAEANARLIASAPDLLAALKKAVQALDITGDHYEEIEVDGEMIDTSDIMDDLRAAISKATGGEE